MHTKPGKISDAITLFCIASREKSLLRFSGGRILKRRPSSIYSATTQRRHKDKSFLMWKIKHGKMSADKQLQEKQLSLFINPFSFTYSFIFYQIMPVKYITNMHPFTQIFNLITQHVFAFHSLFTHSCLKFEKFQRVCIIVLFLIENIWLTQHGGPLSPQQKTCRQRVSLLTCSHTDIQSTSDTSCTYLTLVTIFEFGERKHFILRGIKNVKQW